MAGRKSKQEEFVEMLRNMSAEEINNIRNGYSEPKKNPVKAPKATPINNDDMSIEELEALRDNKFDEYASTPKGFTKAKLLDELEEIETRLEAARNAVNSSNDINSSQIESIVSKAVSSALADAMKNQNALISQISSLTTVMREQNSEIAKLKAEIESLKAAQINNLNNIQNQINNAKTSVDVDSTATKEVTNEKEPYKPFGGMYEKEANKKKGATKQYQDAMKDAEEIYLKNLEQEYAEMAARQGNLSFIKDFVDRYPTFSDLPESIKQDLSEITKNNNDIYAIIKSNMFTWDEEVEKITMDNAIDDPTDEQISHLSESSVPYVESEIGSLDDFEEIIGLNS